MSITFPIGNYVQYDDNGEAFVNLRVTNPETGRVYDFYGKLNTGGDVENLLNRSAVTTGRELDPQVIQARRLTQDEMDELLKKHRGDLEK